MRSESDKPLDPEKCTLNNVQFVESKKQKYPGFRRNLYNYFSEYSFNTGIHGFKYMGEQERSIVEKIYWLILFCISLYFCVSLIVETWIKWDLSPVLVSFARNPTPVWQVPFPAITICSETKSRQRIFNFTDYYHKMNEHLISDGKILTEEELQKFADVSLICENHLYGKGNKTTNYEAIKFLMDVAPPFEEMFFSCKWTNVNETCDNLFSPVLTEDGICFTFNMLDKEELFTNAVFLHDDDFLKNGKKSGGWTLEGGYPKTAEKDTFPKRAMSAGSKAGMYLLLRAYEQDLDYICRGPVQGFKVLLHHPAEVPTVGSQYFRAPLNQEVVVAVKPNMITTSAALRNYSPQRRQCFFSSERQLLFFQNYTQRNCQVECVANYTLAKCGCVSYHMPHLENTRICGSGSTVCVFEAEQELLAREVEAGISGLNSKDAEDLPGYCKCLPSCTSIAYNAEISQADFNWPQVFEAFKADVSEFPGIQLTRLTIFFKDMQFITSERNELYGQTDFLANCGGLLALFTGFSFLSIVEIIYFLSLRLVCNVRKYGVHFWSGSTALLENDSYLHK